MNYLCVLDKDESIECFFIKQFNKIHSRRLLISVNLELFYENKDRIVQDITDIENGIYRDFDKNQENYYYVISYIDAQDEMRLKGYRLFLQHVDVPATEKNKNVIDLIAAEIKKSGFENWDIDDYVLIFNDKNLRLY